MKKDRSLSETLLLLLFSLAIIPASLFSWGWCFWKSYIWFIAPLGAPSITLAHAIGVSLTFDLIKGLGSDGLKKDLKEDDSAELLWRSFGRTIAPFFILSISWLVKSHM